MILYRAGVGLGQQAEARKVGTPGCERNLDQRYPIGGLNVHLGTVFNTL